jgi:SAM-dependent methyltransferase
MGWYDFAATLIEGKSVLDVGCGLGKGLELLKSKASCATGLDLDPRLAGADVVIGSVEDFADDSFDWCMAIDVVEHVDAPDAFLAQLCRVAREAFFVTTPNYVATRRRNPYHSQEWTPRAFSRICGTFGKITHYKGNSTGSEIYKIQSTSAYYALNELRVWWPTAFEARCLNKLLPPRRKILNHQGILIELS